MITPEKGAWILLDKNIEELMTQGLPKIGDRVLIYSYSKNPEENSLIATLLDNTANPEYIHVDTNKTNLAVGT